VDERMRLKPAIAGSTGVLPGTVLILTAAFYISCGNPASAETGSGDRESSIPQGSIKVTPDTDLFPPVFHLNGWSDPEPLEGPVNTAGVEDAPVVSPQGDLLFFFFTPDASVPAEDQITDGYTGVWWCQLSGGTWQEPVRAVLCSGLSLDGPMDYHSDTLWFASIREGTWMDDGDIYTAVLEGDSWNWVNAGSRLNSDINVGEVTVAPSGDTLIFARSSQYGQYGGYDLWMSYMESGTWSDPQNLGQSLNSPSNDGWPSLNPDGTELWFTRSESELGYPGPAVYRSTWNGSSWNQPEEVVSNFCGDPAVDSEGNLYFTHVYADSTGGIIETDIYMAERR
jgi:hypothetical protein